MKGGILQIGANKEVNDDEIEWEPLVFASAVAVRECRRRLCCQVYPQRVGSAVLFKSSLSEESRVFDDKLDFAIAEESSRCLVEHSIVGEGASSCLYARYSVEASGLLPITIAMAHPINWLRRVMRCQALVSSLSPQGALHRVYCKATWHIFLASP